MSSIMREPKFPRFMALLYSRGSNVKEFTDLLISEGYDEYNYNLVRRKLRGDSALEWDDIIVFCKVIGVNESIFFNGQFTNCKPEEVNCV